MNKHDFNVGDGASVHVGSDSYPATVSRVTRTRVYVKQDFYRNTNGENFMSGSPTFEYTPNPEAFEEGFSVRKNGRLVALGASARSRHTLSSGRRYYQDPHF